MTVRRLINRAYRVQERKQLGRAERKPDPTRTVPPNLPRETGWTPYPASAYSPA